MRKRRYLWLIHWEHEILRDQNRMGNMFSLGKDNALQGMDKTVFLCYNVADKSMIDTRERL